MGEKAQISDVGLVRLLGEYTEKADVAHQRYSFRRNFLVLATVITSALVGCSIVFAIHELRPEKFSNPIILFATMLEIALVLTISTTYVALKLLRHISRKSRLGLATWQLRRVYELVSRREDLGVDVDSGTRLEMELRLSEAAFVLTRLERFERPEKFRQFLRMGRNSPFREIEPEDLPTSPSATNVTRQPEPNSATPPDFSTSAS